MLSAGALFGPLVALSERHLSGALFARRSSFPDLLTASMAETPLIWDAGE